MPEPHDVRADAFIDIDLVADEIADERHITGRQVALQLYTVERGPKHLDLVAPPMDT